MEILTNPATSRRRKAELSLANVIMCLSVIFIHVSSEPVTLLLKGSWQFAVITTAVHLAGFAVPGFIFLSGLKLFLHYGETVNYRQFYWRRFTVVVLPYIVWFSLYEIYFLQKHFVVFDPGAMVKSFFLGDLVGPFYFVVVIVEFYVLMPLWRHWLGKAKPFTALLIAFGIMMLSKSLPELVPMVIPGWDFSYANTIFSSYLFFWVGGCLAGRYYEAFLRLLVSRRRELLFALLGVAAADAVAWYFLAEVDIPVFWLNLIRMSYCALAVCGVLLAAKTSGEWSFFKSRFFKTLDRSAYPIFLSHSLVIFMVNGFLDGYGVVSLDLRYVFRIVVTYTVAVTFCMLWQLGKERSGVWRAKKK